MTKPSKSPYSVQISFWILRKVKIYNNIKYLNINSSRKQIWRDRISTSTITEVMEDSVPVRLQHLCMDVKTWISKLRDFFGQELYSINKIAKNYWLVDLELWEKCVKIMNLMPLLHKCIKLWDQLRATLDETNLCAARNL